MKFFAENGRGIALCAAIAVPAWFLGHAVPVVGGPVFGILAGMLAVMPAAGRWTGANGFRGGIAFTSKKILQYAVVLLGFGMNIQAILKTGAQSLPVIVSTIATSLAIAYVLYRLLKTPLNSTILVGVGSSICGGSAIAATAPIIGANDEEIATSISVIFMFNVIAALVFPTLGGILGLSNDGFGLFAGTAVNDTSSVTAAASSWDGLHGSNTLQFATIVKLTRTLAIIPISLALSVWNAKRNLASSGEPFTLKKALPAFIVYFVLASLLTTFFALPAALTGALKNLSKFFIIMAMTAIGLNTNIVKLAKTGGKPLFIGLCCWIGITAVSLGMQRVLGIW